MRCSLPARRITKTKLRIHSLIEKMALAARVMARGKMVAQRW